MARKHKCRRCGECCRISPRLSNEDIKRIADTGIGKNFFVENINGKNYMKIEENKCVFLGRKGKLYYCKIYAARPEICRLYPGDAKDNCQPERFAFDEYLEKRRNEQD